MRVQVHHQRHPGKKIFSLDTYVVYSLGTISTNHVCPKAKTISEVQIKSGQTIKLNCGCYIQTMDHIIMANETEDMEVHSKWLNWTWTLRELFQQPENKIVTKAIKKIWAKISGKFDADTLLRELNMLVKNTTPNPWVFTSPGIKIAGAMIILLVRLCCWRKCCQSVPTLPYPVPSAPRALLVFNMNWDPICH
jgi:hypothetical protein